MKLSKRLTQIEQMVTSGYAHIWDCCCDHGFLGAALLSRHATTPIHFVDIVPELMAELKNKLHRFYTNSRWETHCLDVAKLPLEQYKGNHLIIIAGVGGDLMIQFIEAIYQKHSGVDIDFLLCPVHHQYALRQKLIELKFGLKNEVLIEDNQRFYEVIHISSVLDGNDKISPIGDRIWQSDSDKQTDIIGQYLDKTLNHYQRIGRGNRANVQHIIDAYRLVRE
ncbi:tRNA (adenine(22)-N(1))-methyltransferase [Vibrio algarum]|uniref:tRNA (Adenine(22)-N(1))-methyltransferase TrmK n=1 Tax=Vibrio algarum TaxID=3020714 RepID=A0ABT4YT24_9VIBR|nr:tRNA (adenine(22)-N(1))-methyltransferase TrmK [Vibrio sp. KJ40-1]MDB1124715.1 tRNA (adenine(22)-N(1))-methyltransferase TrmK [Vibrio sp. KJ40-1]